MSPDRLNARVILLDIEGTTTPIAFVHERLFGYVRAHLEPFLAAHLNTSAVGTIVNDLATEHEHDSGEALPPWRTATADQTRESVAAYARWLMDLDRKSPGLKALQGLIWQGAYQAGEIRGEVFDDVPRAMTRWREAGVTIAIYSSGSELAQRLLFTSTPHGNLTSLIERFFDTRVGPKTSAESYRRIASALGHQAREMLFVSDVVAELSAAGAAGCQVRLCVRPGNAPVADAAAVARIRSFDELS